jgi:hypothetical protein
MGIGGWNVFISGARLYWCPAYGNGGPVANPADNSFVGVDGGKSLTITGAVSGGVVTWTATFRFALTGPNYAVFLYRKTGNPSGSYSHISSSYYGNASNGGGGPINPQQISGWG